MRSARRDQWASCANASLKNGSLSGISARLRRLRANRNSQTPASPTGTRRPSSGSGSRACANVGATSQISVDEAHHEDEDRDAREQRRPLLQVLRQQQQNGSDEVPDDQRDARRTPQPPRIRSRYQGISSGRLPDQMIRNCEKLRVRPQHHEGEQQLAEIVEVPRLQDVRPAAPDAAERSRGRRSSNAKRRQAPAGDRSAGRRSSRTSAGRAT